MGELLTLLAFRLNSLDVQITDVENWAFRDPKPCPFMLGSTTGIHCLSMIGHAA